MRKEFVGYIDTDFGDDPYCYGVHTVLVDEEGGLLFDSNIALEGMAHGQKVKITIETEVTTNRE